MATSKTLPRRPAFQRLCAQSAAKILRTTRTGKIIVTVPDISDPFFAKVIRGVEQAAQKGAAQLEICHLP
jgi:DNA-binding LacI/PurR family transcriptional regulator